MSDRIIYVDMDGVLTDFVGRCLNWFGSDLKDSEINAWNIEKFLGFTEEELWAGIRNRGFWQDMSEYPWTDDLWDTIARYGRPVVLTSPGASPGACSGKLLWLQEYFNADFKNWIFTNHKHLIAKPGQILIDDSDKNCDAWEAVGGIAIRFPQYWNSLRKLRKSPAHRPVEYVEEQLRRWIPVDTGAQFSNNQTDGV